MAITVDDLIEKCPECGGAGIARPGKPRTISGGCAACQGKGRVPTESGRAILLLMESFRNDYRGRFPLPGPDLAPD